uniref:PIN domain-containing protein n=1 Tax=Candidatus Kentrum sp. DK TaxID=2126562 RepID=A0A450T4L0_9GAMM|nr:MAG: hypothetical protein BECKDK2373B_GA0170837_105721 [Candidatus Kentron sp. DK]VFJ61492.1 MAG: hypothetical protein BECKDK2373C_GA0170839_108916 [Candidatus Kentron sp. DK]
MKVYADTSVFGGAFGTEFAEPTKQFFAEIDAGRFALVTSAIVEAEIEPAPDRIRGFFARYESIAEIAQVTEEALLLHKHIVHFDKIPEYNAINTQNGYGQIGIYSPLEIIDYGGDDA